MKELGLQISEKEYRNLPYPSFSLLSDMINTGPSALYGEKADISDNDAIIVGSIVDYKLSYGKYPQMCVMDKKPSGKALETVKMMVSRRHEWNDLDDPFHVDNLDILSDCIEITDYYSQAKKIDTKIKHLRNYENYAQILMENASDDIMMVSSDQWRRASECIDSVETRFPWLSADNPDLIFQVKLKGELMGITFKGMLDFVKIEGNKTIIPYDIKTGSKPHYMFEESYLHWKYYLQACLYRNLLKKALPGWTVGDFRFMYVSKADNIATMYRVPAHRHQQAIEGFTHEGVNYIGLEDAIKEYKFYAENPDNVYKYRFHTDEVLL